jgi:hypothetical protein
MGSDEQQVVFPLDFTSAFVEVDDYKSEKVESQ